MSIKKLIEQTRNNQMTVSEKENKINEFFENREVIKLLQELKKLDLLENNYTDIIDMGWDRYRISIYRDLSMIIDRFDKTRIIGEPINKNPWRPQLSTTFDDTITINLLKSNVNVKDMLNILETAFFGEK